MPGDVRWTKVNRSRSESPDTSIFGLMERTSENRSKCRLLNMRIIWWPGFKTFWRMKTPFRSMMVSSLHRFDSNSVRYSIPQRVQECRQDHLQETVSNLRSHLLLPCARDHRFRSWSSPQHCVQTLLFVHPRIRSGRSQRNGSSEPSHRENQPTAQRQGRPQRKRWWRWWPRRRVKESVQNKIVRFDSHFLWSDWRNDEELQMWWFII